MVNLTHASGGVQVVSVQIREISVTVLSICRIRYHDLKLSSQNREFTPQFSPQFNWVSALTPPRSAIIISVSVRSAELRLVLYV